MALNGLKGGLKGGILQGVKSNTGMSNLKSGLLSGITSSISDKNKMQNPLLLIGSEKPIAYGLADFCTGEGTGQLTMTDIANTGKTLISNLSTSNRPIQTPNKIGNKDSLVYANSAAVMTTSASLSSSAKSAYSYMFVCKLNGTPNSWILYDNRVTSSIGATQIITDATDPYSIESNLSVTGSLITSFNTLTPSINYMRDYILLTIKHRAQNTNGPGSEQEIHVNGTLNKYTITSTTTPIASSTYSVPIIGVGNTPGGSPANALNFELGAFLCFDYWLNESEQLRLENYFRWYYNKKF